MVDEDSTNGASAGNGSSREDSIARLMRLAGPRPAVPQAVRERVHAAVKREWRGKVARQRTRRWGRRAIPAALAAGVLLAVVLGGRVPLIDPAPVATVAVVGGGSGTQSLRLHPGDPVYPGDSIRTGGSGAALALGNGVSLRLAANTTATVGAIDEVTLTAGRIYADTGPAIRADRTITVHTNIGSATDHGTQFAIGYDGVAMSVAVREGSVEVDARRASYTAEAGEKLTFRKGEKARYSELPPHDRSWGWASALAPSFDIDQRPVINFLRWAARETGRELVFASEGVRLAAMATRLSGSVAGLTPSEAIEAVRPTIPRFDLHVDERRVIVRLAQ